MFATDQHKLAMDKRSEQYKEETESVRLSKKQIDKVRRQAGKNKRTLRAELELVIDKGLIARELEWK